MKRILLFILFLIAPFVVKASDDVEITKVEMLEKSDGTTVISEPAFKNLKVDFDLKFSVVDDYIKYEITVMNNSKEDYELEDETKFSNGEYVKYETKFSNTSKVLKPGEENKAIITITYTKEIPDYVFNEDGTYTESNKYTVDLSHNESNPYTSTTLSIAIVIILVLSLTLTILFASKKKGLSMLIIGLTILTIPFVVNGLKKLSFIVDTKIHIDAIPYTFKTDRGSFSSTEDVKEIQFIAYPLEKYEYTGYGFLTSTKPTTDHYLVMSFHSEYFIEDSYIRVYDNETDELLVEVTKESFGIYLFDAPSIRSFTTDHYYKELPGYEGEDVRVEISPDLERNGRETYTVPYAKMYTTTSSTQKTYYGPFTTDRDVINKIWFLNTSVTDQCITGFAKDSNDNRIYNAIWSTDCHTGESS